MGLPGWHEGSGFETGSAFAVPLTTDIKTSGEAKTDRGGAIKTAEIDGLDKKPDMGGLLIFLLTIALALSSGCTDKQDGGKSSNLAEMRIKEFVERLLGAAPELFGGGCDNHSGYPGV